VHPNHFFHIPFWVSLLGLSQKGREEFVGILIGAELRRGWICSLIASLRDSAAVLKTKNVLRLNNVLSRPKERQQGLFAYRSESRRISRTRTGFLSIAEPS
jgi:hypothetical protein